MDGFLERLPELVIVVGKGGVGKTTCAIGVASALAAAGQPTLLVSTDPAGSLGPVLGTTLAGGVARQIEAVPRLAAMQLEPAVTRKEFLARWRDVIATIVDRGTYLDVDAVSGLVAPSVPGAQVNPGLLLHAHFPSALATNDTSI